MLQQALYPGELIGRHLKWKIILWWRQKDRTHETWFLFFDQSHKFCMTLSKPINSSMSMFFSKIVGTNGFCQILLFSKQRGSSANCFLLISIIKTSFLLCSSVFPEFKTKNPFIFSWSVFIWILKSDQVLFYINWPRSFITSFHYYNLLLFTRQWFQASESTWENYFTNVICRNELWVWLRDCVCASE